jgi:UDP-glucose 4-epimerase
MFDYKTKYLPKRPGERFSSALKRMNLTNKVIRINAKIKLKDYIKDFLSKSF